MLTFVDPQKKVSRGELESVKSPDLGPLSTAQIAKLGNIVFFTSPGCWWPGQKPHPGFAEQRNLVLTNVDP